jgi:GxxExxY protein
MKNLEARKPGSTLGNIDLTDKIIGAAIRVHRELGPGFLESIYEEALAFEFGASGIKFERQKPLPIVYRGHHVGEHRLDFLVEGLVVVELKAISSLEDIHFAIVRSYLKASLLDDALLLNFANTKPTIRRVGREQLPHLLLVSVFNSWLPGFQIHQ